MGCIITERTTFVKAKNLWWHSWPWVFLPIFRRLSFSHVLMYCRLDSCTLWQNGARWSGSFSSPLTTEGTHVLFSSSKIKTSIGLPKKEWRESEENFYFFPATKGLSQTWLWAEISVTQLRHALYRGGSSVSKSLQHTRRPHFVQRTVHVKFLSITDEISWLNILQSSNHFLSESTSTIWIK